jgi:hypothetical protein
LCHAQFFVEGEDDDEGCSSTFETILRKFRTSQILVDALESVPRGEKERVLENATVTRSDNEIRADRIDADTPNLGLR